MLTPPTPPSTQPRASFPLPFSCVTVMFPDVKFTLGRNNATQVSLGEQMSLLDLCTGAWVTPKQLYH